MQNPSTTRPLLNQILSLSLATILALLTVDSVMCLAIVEPWYRSLWTGFAVQFAIIFETMRSRGLIGTGLAQFAVAQCVSAIQANGYTFGSQATIVGMGFCYWAALYLFPTWFSTSIYSYFALISWASASPSNLADCAREWLQDNLQSTAAVHISFLLLGAIVSCFLHLCLVDLSRRQPEPPEPVTPTPQT